MGWDYAIVHLKYTIPPAIALTALYRPLFTRLDVYKLIFLISIAVISTIPWDSYLIRHRIWTYPPNAVIGWTLFDIPAEEVFFFFIQTYNTSFIYFILSKATLHPIYLVAELSNGEFSQLWSAIRTLGQLSIGGVIYLGYRLFEAGGEGSYMGLILIWAGPFLFALWSLAYQLLVRLPLTNTLLPIAIPTLYLWMVDTFSLKRGTWVIESGTKLDLYLWPNLELEEAVFFLATNVLIVFGLVAFDNAFAILNAFPSIFSHHSTDLPTPIHLVEALLTSSKWYDLATLTALRDATVRLQRKSRSFFLASGTFQGLLRTDLILLYSYCRVADDLIDNASSLIEAETWISKLRKFLDIVFDPATAPSKWSYVRDNFPAHLRPALLYLPTSRLTSQPLYDLLKGFEMDLKFPAHPSPAHDASLLPIQTEQDLLKYSSFVAGTIAELCLSLVASHYPAQIPRDSELHDKLAKAGHQMGIALQLVNIARDIEVDATTMSRIYLPVTWLKGVSLGPEDILKVPRREEVGVLRTRLLDMAFDIYHREIGAIELLPREVRGPMRTAVESYMEIGAVLREEGARKPTVAGEKQTAMPKESAGYRKATVPTRRRIWVAWRAMSGPLQRRV